MVGLGRTRTRTRTGTRSRSAGAGLAATLLLTALAVAGPGTGTASADSTTCPSFTAAAARSMHASALGADGTVWGWGGNGSGELGDGTTTQRPTPVKASGVSGVTAIAAGDNHTLAVLSNGTVLAWGYNQYGQLGDNTTTTRTTAVQVSGLSGVVAVAAAQDYSVALKSDGTVWEWGYTRLNAPSHVPLQIAGVGNVIAIATGTYHTIALKADGTVWGWGYNYYGQLGNGSSSDPGVPWQTSSLTGVVAIAAGGYHSMALKSDGTVRGWGYNYYGEVGDGTTTTRYVPTAPSPPLTGVTAIGAGDFHSLAVGAAGSVYTWGRNSEGQLGDGSYTERHQPVQVPGVTGASSATAGFGHSVVVGPAGGIRTWGDDYYDQLGDTAKASRNTPGPITCPSPPTAVSASDTPDPVVAGNSLTFAMSWTDPNAGEQARAVVCKTNAVSAGTCPGGAWATGSLTAPGASATASHQTSNAELGTQAYYAFVCDASSLCSSSLSGTFTVTSGAPSVLSVSDTPDPAAAGTAVTFTASWTDPNPSDKQTLLVCRTSSVSPSYCPGGTLAVGSQSSANPATATHWTSDADIGTQTYYAFVCDSTGVCSNGSSGTLTVTSSTPSAVSASDTPDPVVAGNTVTFAVGWTDPNPADQERAVICMTDAVSGGYCPGGAWAIGSLSSTNPATASYRTTNLDVGTHQYHAFVCDASDRCSGSLAGTFTVNGAGQCYDGADNDGDGKVDYPSDPGCSSTQDPSEGASCDPLAPGVVVCLSAGASIASYTVAGPDVSLTGTEHHVAGYVDLYRFTVAGVTTTLPCASLVADGIGVNPCEAAGGTFVSRVSTLVDAKQAEPVVSAGGPIATVGICAAELTVTAFGIGVNSAPAYALCS
jgi:alpha-tubulin suppressor-like RCC1 family protein